MKAQNNKYSKRSRNVKGKGKEMEMNVKDADINMADLPGSKRDRRSGKKDKHDNDISWYSHYPTLLEGVTGINYAVPLGSPLNLASPGNYTNAEGQKVPINYATPQTIAGICSVGFIPTLGTANKNSDSVANKVAVQLYSAMRMSLGSTANYEPVDIMMYLGAMDSALLLYALGVKIYGSIRMASPMNYYMMKGIVNAAGADYDSFNTNLNDFRAFINKFAIYLSSLEVPASFDIFKRHVWMLQNIFTDSDAAKAQMYTYRLDGYYTYEETTENVGTFLKFHPLVDVNGNYTQWTFDSYVAAVQEVLNKLLGSSDVSQMSADIGKAFDHDVYIMSQIGEDYTTPISYSMEVLSQFENCTLEGVPVQSGVQNLPTGISPWDIYQDNSLSLTNPQVLQTPAFVPFAQTSNDPSLWSDQSRANYLGMMDASKVLNFHKTTINAADTIVATRGTSGYHSYYMLADGSRPRYIPNTYGTELYTFGQFYNITPGAGPLGTFAPLAFAYINACADNGDGLLNSQALSTVWSQFDWAPTILLANGGLTAFRRLQDTDMYAVINSNQLESMHTCAVLSEFWSPKFPQLHE